MRILVTNDDGITSPILPFLVEQASRLGEVTVVAPATEQSGMSHAIDFTHPQEIKPVDIPHAARAFSMTSTPADCVRFAVLGLDTHYDLVLSGINRGLNLGRDIVYSGTVGAIFEAWRLDMKGVALSCDPSDFAPARERLREVYRYFAEHDLLSLCPLYNVNIPKGNGDIRMTRQGGIYFADRFVRREGHIYVQEGEPLPCDALDLTVDLDCIHRGHISITPLVGDLTCHSVLDALK